MQTLIAYQTKCLYLQIFRSKATTIHQIQLTILKEILYES